MKDIYNLDLHERVLVDQNKKGSTSLEVLRVPGGWIYTQKHTRDHYQSTFVPFNKQSNCGGV